MKLQIKYTADPTIVQLEAPVVLVKGNYQYSKGDNTQDSPLAGELLRLPFIKTVYFSANFIALQSTGNIRWEEVAPELVGQIETALSQGEALVYVPGEETKEAAPKRIPVTIYVESTPNPMAMKFVANKKLVSRPYEFKTIEEAENSPLAQALFGFDFVKSVFFDANYVSITRLPRSTPWEEVMMETREFLRQYLMEGKTVVKVAVSEEDRPKGLPRLGDIYSKKIVALLDQYIRPAVSSDGGNIEFVSYDKETHKVKVVLQGACNGCPSSRITLKQGIEGLLREQLKDDKLTVEAVDNV